MPKLMVRYRTYYLQPRIWAVKVAPRVVNDLERALKDLLTHRDLNADKKRKRELVVECTELEHAFVTVAAHGDRSKIITLGC